MKNIINGKYTESQPIEVLSSSSQLNLSEDQLRNAFVPILHSRDKKDLLMLECILKVNLHEKRNVRVEDLMAYMNISNPSISIRLRKMRELNISGVDFPLLKAIKSGNAFLYSFTDVIEYDKALKMVQDVMSTRGINYDKYAAEKSILSKQSLSTDATDTNYIGEVDEEDYWQKDEESEDFVEEVHEQMEGNSEYSTDENQTIEKVSFDELSTRTVTMGEVLEMLDETSNALIENITEGITEIFNEKITGLNNRIVELEKKLSSSQSCNSNQESTEELLARARILVRQKIFAKKDK